MCGTDLYSGQCFEHRRDWVEQRLLLLTQVFAIDIAAYAVMSNHLHVVLRIDIDTAQAWSDNEVVQHWHQLFKGTLLTQRFAKGEAIEPYFMALLNDTIAEYRRRLTDISWFMRALNEPIARQANKEDNCNWAITLGKSGKGALNPRLC
ncbi:hypothetical protein GCM10011502_30150 [Oceanisphaera marina]|uniref:Transposase n=1 Tax=Oceanisphaera marina TaxID=2017550 RepID=A0ABQ1IZK3_9GAMM|nr:transposase [Oceanisphaera marina]GGB55171.1 hypothetical protein GCM10011502_30150 [Oceanisphaera marina]